MDVHAYATPTSLVHFYEKDSYVDDLLWIVTVGKANFHCF